MQQNQDRDPAVSTGLSMSALWVAHARAEESARSDRLFEDSLAEAFIAAAGSVTPPQLKERFGEIYPYIRDHVAIRTRFFDDYLLEACAAGCRQVAVLAAGVDTRAFRLPWPEGVRLFELDLPEIFTFKEQVLARRGAKPVCQRIVVEADLSEEWSAPLLRAGFRPDEPTAWLAEGILPFLTEEENDKLLARISDLSALGSRLAFEHTNLDMQELREVPALRQAAESFEEHGVSTGAVLEDLQKWLVRHGWQGQVYDEANFAASYNRAVPNFEVFAGVDTAMWWLGKVVRGAT
jgi:methyltransferase (TIGR00027 family)